MERRTDDGLDDVGDRQTCGPGADVSVAGAASRPAWFRTALWLHRWTGLAATPFFLVLCITGSILIFHEEIDHALGDVPRLEGAAAAAGGWSTLVRNVVLPGERLVSVFHDPKTPRQLMVFVAPAGFAKLEDAKPRIIDLATGQPARMSDPDTTLTGVVLQLHSKWFAGFAGELFGGVVAVLTLISLTTGVAIYAPYVRNVLFGVVRRRRGARIVQLDLHNLVGLVILGWALVVTATGACLALGTLLLALYQQGELKTMSAMSATGGVVTTPVDIDRVVGASAAAAPDRQVRFVVYPDTDFSGRASFTVFAYGALPYNERLFDVGIVDARTAKVLAFRPLPLYLTVLVLSEPLHFGNYGGLALKLFWVVNAFGALFITANGAWLWLRRGRSKGALSTDKVQR